ncbi:hypothetical protein [uncultured Dubosiella sp.]|uniref:hypothetical protein n=1 Tax=uncultured Dubosiella sp. TaxID=1937011 RepID=UPI0025999F76|nr:hypothetical protein [uncultured Dubosiella sp.]
MKRKRFITFTSWLCLVIELVYWFSTAVLVCVLASTFFDSPLAAETLDFANWNLSQSNVYNGIVKIWKLNIPVFRFFSSHEITIPTLQTVLLCGLLTSTLNALCFHFLYRLLHQTKKELEATNLASAFQTGQAERIKKAGILLLSIPFLQLGFSFLLNLPNLSTPSYDIAWSFESLVLGLLLIALSTYFQSGIHLQQDVDGLI